MSTRLLSSHLKAPFVPKSRTTLRPTNPSLSAFPPHRTVAGGPQKTQPFKIWPFVAILALGSGTYVYMVRSRVGAENNSPRTRPRNTSSGPSPNH